jgi:4-aminobutyrate aminotransferase-like enzyme
LTLFNPETCGMACAEALADVIQFETSDNVAFFVAEPVMGEGGIIVPPADYFKTVYALNNFESERSRTKVEFRHELRITRPS